MARSSSTLGAGATPAYLTRVLASLPSALFVVDEGGKVLFAAGALESIATRTEEQLVGRHLVEFVAEPERPVVAELLAAAAAAPETETVGPAHVSYFDDDGTQRSTEVWGINRMRDPEIEGICVLLLPESAYDHFDQVLMSIVAGSSLEQTFGSLARALRYPPVLAESFFVMPGQDDRTVIRVPDLEEVPGPPGIGPWDDVWDTPDPMVHTPAGQLPPQLREAAKKAGFASLACFPIHRNAAGHAGACLVVWLRSGESPHLNAYMAIERAAVIASLAISRMAEEAGLKDAAYRDVLTGLGNRRSFFEALEVQVKAGERPTVLYIDLDGFKAVNDSFGHLAGDAVLRVAARRLASVMRPTDELARLGGDEFAVLCGGAVSRAQVAAIAERIVEQLSRPLSVGDGQTVDCGASVGIAVDLPVGTPADGIIGRADRALYDAKAKGRGQWAFADGG
jgi:diguanylate cyclase (GGDEF)-like protein/PAS domain S-box-containing protein